MGFLFSKKKIHTPEERRRINNDKIKSLGIACFENLPMIESSTDVKIKDIDTICKRAIASLFSIQVACDIAGGNDYEESKEFFFDFLIKYGVLDCLLEKEKRLFTGEYSQQDVLDITWSYETYWSLVWALGLVDDMDIPNSICDCHKAVRLVGDSKNYRDFKKQCKLRDVEEILDMLDLYYRYHWAVVEKSLKPETSIANLDPGVVMERRRGLEWLFSAEDDWNNISLDT